MSEVNECTIGSGSYKPPKDSPLLSSNRRFFASEKTFLSTSQETSRSYGATRKPEHSPCDYKTVRHVLAPGDTLQGLAIKYKVTVSGLFMFEIMALVLFSGNNNNKSVLDMILSRS